MQNGGIQQHFNLASAERASFGPGVAPPPPPPSPPAIPAPPSSAFPDIPMPRFHYDDDEGDTVGAMQQTSAGAAASSSSAGPASNKLQEGWLVTRRIAGAKARSSPSPCSPAPSRCIASTPAPSCDRTS